MISTSVLGELKPVLQAEGKCSKMKTHMCINL